VDGETLRLEMSDRIAVITLDRPERRNAFTVTMGADLSDAYRACDEDDDVRAVVVTGAPPAFCAGADLSPQEETFVATGPGFSAGGVDFPAWRVRKPVIAAVNGHAVGIGLTLALQRLGIATTAPMSVAASKRLLWSSFERSASDLEL
jgi:enoyl-CoA hydratase/carnithine racemase